MRNAALGTRATLLVAALAATSCDQPADAREWRATDHDHTTKPNAAQQPTTPDGGMLRPPLPGVDEVTIVAWRRSCTRCHGTLGRGDGQEGAATRARDLSDPAWQRSVSDQLMGQSIKSGRGAMPAFDLPEATIAGLVRLVRLFDAARRAQGAAAPSGSTPPSGSSAPAPSGHP